MTLVVPAIAEGVASLYGGTVPVVAIAVAAIRLPPSRQAAAAVETSATVLSGTPFRAVECFWTDTTVFT